MNFMVVDEIDIPLSKEEELDKINFLKKTKFDNFKIHPYYNRDSYIKHVVELETIKEIYPKYLANYIILVELGK